MSFPLSSQSMLKSKRTSLVRETRIEVPMTRRCTPARKSSSMARAGAVRIVFFIKEKLHKGSIKGAWREVIFSCKVKIGMDRKIEMKVPERENHGWR